MAWLSGAPRACGPGESCRAARRPRPSNARAAIEKFIAAKGGTPIVENQTRLIFLAKDKDGQTPRIVGDFNDWATTAQGYDVSIGKPTRIEGTSWSYLESTSYTNARLEYVFFFDKEAAADPMNPRTVQAFAGPRSEVRMPFCVAQPEVDEAGSAPKGRTHRRDTDVAIRLAARAGCGSTCRPGTTPATDTLFPVVYVLDGSNYVEKMDMPRVLDHLIANKSIPPVIAVFSEPADRQEEYSRNPQWRAFVANELVPMVDKRFRTFSAPDHRVILGSSLAAYGAVDLAVEYPSVFGLCAAIAPPAQTAIAGLESTERPSGGGVDQVLRDGRRLRLDDRRRPPPADHARRVFGAGQLPRGLRRPQHQYLPRAPGRRAQGADATSAIEVIVSSGAAASTVR